MLKHIPGSKMGKADSLSRRLNWEVGVERDNEDETLVKPKWLEVRRTERVNNCERSRSIGESKEVKSKR